VTNDKFLFDANLECDEHGHNKREVKWSGCLG
jgi:hypothetical protein